jgi:PAS domain-containing protein
VAARSSAASEHEVSPEVMAAVFHGVTVSDVTAVVVVEPVGGVLRASWVNDKAGALLGYAPEDLQALPFDSLLPTLSGGELRLLLRRERAVRMTLPVRHASGALLDCSVAAVPALVGRRWTVRFTSTANETERALRATADAHERRFSTLTERSPIPTLLSE